VSRAGVKAKAIHQNPIRHEAAGNLLNIFKTSLCDACKTDQALASLQFDI
jgi:hypothetical protein